MKDDGLDYLAQQMRIKQRRNLTPLALRQARSAPLPPTLEVLQGIGGTTVYRSRLGCRVTESGER